MAAVSRVIVNRVDGGKPACSATSAGNGETSPRLHIPARLANHYIQPRCDHGPWVTWCGTGGSPQTFLCELYDWWVMVPIYPILRWVSWLRLLTSHCKNPNGTGTEERPEAHHISRSTALRSRRFHAVAVFFAKWSRRTRPYVEFGPLRGVLCLGIVWRWVGTHVVFVTSPSAKPIPRPKLGKEIRSYGTRRPHA